MIHTGERYIELLGRVFERLFQAAEISKFNSRERRAYEQSVNAYRDIKNGMDSARKEGLKKGIKQGLQQGLQQGIKQGLQQGIKQGLQQGIQQGEHHANLKNAKAMKAMGLPFETIQKITGLTREEIDNL